jgi:hypothetical protein
VLSAGIDGLTGASQGFFVNPVRFDNISSNNNVVSTGGDTGNNSQAPYALAINTKVYSQQRCS